MKMTKTLLIIILLIIFKGCFTFSAKPVSQYSFASGSTRSCGIRIQYKAQLQTASNYIASLAFGTTEWLEYSIDGHLAARHQAHQHLNTVVYLDPGEHKLDIHNVGQGVITLGTRQKILVKSYSFTVYDGQIGLLKMETINGEYLPNIGAAGFEDVSDWQEN